MLALILLLILVAIFFGVGLAVKALFWLFIIGIILLVLWALGFLFRPGGRTWYYW